MGSSLESRNRNKGMGSGTGEMRPTDSLGLHDLVGSGTAVLSSDLAEEKGCSFLIAVTKILDGDDLLGTAYGEEGFILLMSEDSIPQHRKDMPR